MNNEFGRRSAIPAATSAGPISSPLPRPPRPRVSISGRRSHVSCSAPVSNVRASCSGAHVSRTPSGAGRKPWSTYSRRPFGIEELHRWLRPVVLDRRLERVERLAAPAGALDHRRGFAVGPVDTGREDDRLECDDQIEQPGIPVRRHQEPCAAHRVTEPDEATVRSDRSGGGEGIVAVAMPVDLPVVGARCRAVASMVPRGRREPVRQMIGDREVAVAMKSGGVRQQQWPSRPAEFVDGNADVI